MSAQSDQSLCCLHEETLHPSPPKMRSEKILITQQKRRLILVWIFVGRICPKVRFLTLWLYTDLLYKHFIVYSITQPTIWEVTKHVWLYKAFSPVTKASHRFLENYHRGSYFGLSPGHVNYSFDRSQPDWTGSQRTITRAHNLDYLPVRWIIAD